MKVQTATLETAISIFFIAAVLSMIARSESSEISNVYFSKYALQSSMALFDISNQLEYNSTAASCVVSAYFNGSQCLQNYIYTYEHAYKARGIEIVIYDKRFGYVENATAHTCIISHRYGYPICIFIGD
ncbi:MAG: hypothetical protein QW346_00940 [Candidatus Micrarchaeaceae archaeon]